MSSITPAQCRAARALLNWSQNDLADRAHIGLSTVADFERGARVTHGANVVLMRRALENAGVTFIRGGCFDNGAR